MSDTIDTSSEEQSKEKSQSDVAKTVAQGADSQSTPAGSETLTSDVTPSSEKSDSNAETKTSDEAELSGLTPGDLVPSGAQSEMAFAVVDGQPMTQMPLDLYIPPDALEVILEAFEGPLDLLLYLIKRQNLDILNIQVAEITRQYMDYIEFMEGMQWELAAEYLVMAAVLAEVKSRMLLPRQNENDEDEEDPRAELIRRLQEYERFKQAALDVDDLKRLNRDYWIASAEAPIIDRERPLPDVNLQEMLLALAKVLKRVDNQSSHKVELELLSTRERMSSILNQVQTAGDQFLPFISLFDSEEGRSGVIVTFLAMLELIKESLLELIQTEPFAPIHVKARAVSDDTTEEQL